MLGRRAQARRLRRLASRKWSLALLFLLPAPFPAAEAVAQQPRVISGRVVAAETVQPLSGVQISLKGTAIGTLSTGDGGFILEVPPGEVVLVFQSLGYRTQEVTVAAEQNTVEVELSLDPLSLDELVVTGRATSIARRNLPHAVSTVQGEQLVEVPPQTLAQALYGKVAGANIQANSGAPGGGFQIDLRGATTAIGQHKPLYVVDGVIINNETFSSGIFSITQSSSDPVTGGMQDNAPNRLADLNPNDIATIEILKGAAAAAQYGSKASNGVIVITTKRGRGGETRYNMNLRVGTSALSEKVGLRRYRSREAAAAVFGDATAALWAPGRFFDHEEIIAGRNPVNYELSGSASGSLGGTNFFASGLVRDQGGVVIGTGYSKQSLRVNLDQAVGDRLLLGLSTNFIHTQTARGFTNNDNSNTSYWMTFPFTPTFIDLRQRPDGTWPINPNTASNPIQTATEAENDEEVWRFIGALQANLLLFQTPSQSLRFLARGGIDYFNQNNAVFTPPTLQFEPNDDGLLGTSIRGDVGSYNANLEGNAIYEALLGGGIRSTTSAGVQYEVSDFDFARTIAENLIAGQQNVNRGTVIGVLHNRERVEDVGIYVQEEVLIDDRFLLSAGVRADQSSTNTKDDRLFAYPKAGASYVFEDLAPGLVDELKVRVAYGEAGNRPLYGQKFTGLLGQNIEGLATLGIEGQTAGALKPERQREIETGVDLILFNERANLQLTVYQKNVDDLLVRRELPPSTGFQAAVFNGGAARVRGVEASLNVIPLQRENTRWRILTNFSLNRSKVTDLPVPPFQVAGFGFLFGTFVLSEGQSLTSMWGNVTLPDGTVTTAPIGDSNPDFRVGLASDFEYRRWSFHTVADWQAGGDVFNLTRLLFDLGANSEDCTTILQGGESVCERRLRLWPTNTSTYLESATFLKIRELGLTYTLPSSIRGFFFGGSVRNATMSFTARDLFTFTSYSGLDPEVSNFGSQAIGRNIDVAPYPPSRSFWLSVNLSF